MKVSQIVPAILAKTEEELEAASDVPLTVGVYRASHIGYCARALQYRYLGEKEEKISPETQLLFNDGHLHEVDIRNNMAKVGLVTDIQRPVSKQYTHKGETFILTGTIDFKFNGTICDAKSISTFRYKYLDKNFPQDYLSYVVQQTIYMDIFKDDKCFLMFKDKNSSWLKPKIIKYDPQFMNGILDKVVEIQQGIKAKQLMNRPYGRDTWNCKLCGFRLACWKLPMERRSSL